MATGKTPSFETPFLAKRLLGMRAVAVVFVLTEQSNPCLSEPDTADLTPP
jgi:hypothetical protein